MTPEEFQKSQIAARIKNEIQTSLVINRFLEHVQEIHDEAVSKIREISPFDTAEIMRLQVDMRLAARLQEMISFFTDVGNEAKIDYEETQAEPTEPQEEAFVD